MVIVMRKKGNTMFLSIEDYPTIEDAWNTYPEMHDIISVEGGWHTFATVEDETIWNEQV